MCGRYAIITPAAELRRLFGTTNPLINVEPRYNAAPTQDLAVIRHNPDTGSRHLDLLRWGLVPRWSKDPSTGAKAINARGESVADKPLFRDALNRRRCLVPATAFYEWQPAAGRKQPYAIAPVGGGLMAFAGLWEAWKAPNGDILRTFSIITTTANAATAPIHDRMPVIMPQEVWSVWLGETPASPDDLKGLLRPCPDKFLKTWRVGPEVGSVRVDRAELLAPIPEP
ncbi:MAG: SOS response-associated peptidase [Desulfovibrio sp.]|nr:SOS response-associated peptidase [Desulfovibrio sp.]